MSSHEVIVIFSPAWWLSILLTTVIIIYLINRASRARAKTQYSFSLFIGCFLVSIACFIHLYQFIKGQWTLQSSLPLNLCSISAILSGLALIFRNQRIYEFLLYWGLPGAFYSFLTPELTLGTRGWYIYDYYLSHGGIILSVLYLTVIFKFTPGQDSWLKVFAWSQLLLIIVFCMDKYLGANYMYLINKPLARNPLIIGDWPYYILGFELAGLLHMYLIHWILTKGIYSIKLPELKRKPGSIFLLLLFILATNLVIAQHGVQNIRGGIKDRDSELPLSEVTVGLFRDTVLMNTVQSDENGRFLFPDVTPDRYKLRTYLVGYKSSQLTDVIVNTGKETIVDISIEQEAKVLGEVIVNASKNNRSINEMVLTGGKIFSVDETNRYAGSRGDPARMAASFAGTQNSDDSRNDIVIRGNSPTGILWRIEDVDIPNPNHFAIPGTKGGAISILNNKMFRNSDFLLGAFPAEYGNCNAGVFDIKLRNGNNEHHEGTVQFGFLGTELALEGPLSKKANATYLVTYRYSTLKLFEAFKVKIGTDAVPNYQDASFKINLPLKHRDNLSFFGIGGTSKIDIILSQFDKPSEDIYGENNKDQYFRSSMSLLGVTYTKSTQSGWWLKATLSQLFNTAREENFVIFRNKQYRVDSLVRSLGYLFKNDKTALALSLQRKINSRNMIKTGVHIDLLHRDLIDSLYSPVTYTFRNRMNTNEYTTLFQAYSQWKYKWNNDLEMNAGLHAQYAGLNKQLVLEPRFSIQWNLSSKAALSAAAGIYSQLQPYYIYYYKAEGTNGTTDEQNRMLGFSKSFHSLLSYEVHLNENLGLKLETYYMRLFDIPVRSGLSSTYSIINEGADFGRFFPGKLENKGTGYNDGIECTLEKTFSSGYYYMINSSLFESKYKGSDGIVRNTAYSTNFSMNALMGTEVSISKKHNKLLNLGAKISYGGGRRYSPPDIQASRTQGELVVIDSLRNSLQFKNYFRVDMKVGYKINARKVTHEFGIDLVNTFNTKNILAFVYAPDPRNPNDNPLKVENQLGFLPLFYYKLDFTVRKN